MDFVSSIKRNMTTAAYAQFDGRASRSEYWWFYLFTLLAGLAAEIVTSSFRTALFWFAAWSRAQPATKPEVKVIELPPIDG